MTQKRRWRPDKYKAKVQFKLRKRWRNKNLVEALPDDQSTSGNIFISNLFLMFTFNIKTKIPTFTKAFFLCNCASG